MGRIKVLPDLLVDRIAAGEVVERPASVVKELVENGLDAGATSIEVRLESGGKRLIQVRDDGCGMEPDDALLAVQRHATSKISDAEQLDSIATLGFRGEALSSIAAVSRFVLRTSTGGEGCEVTVEYGAVQPVRTIAHPRGTTVRIERLFHSTPARRKFLRSDATELAHAVRWLTRYALARPADRFHMIHGERRMLDAPPAADIVERIGQIYGREFAGRLLPFELRRGETFVHGLAGRPADALSRRDAQQLFVNGRAVQDRVLLSAVTQAYVNTVPRGRHPAVFLFIEIDPGAVDVNVHPQKTEVRFRDPSGIHAAVRAAIQSSLGDAAAVPSLSELRPGAIPAADPREAVRLSTLRWSERAESRPPLPPLAEPAPARAPVQAANVDPDAPRAVALAQFRDSFIVAEDAEGLVLVDQHAAHERVLFERYLDDIRERRVETQRLMFPVVIELSPEEEVTLEAEIDELRRLGFELDVFGERTVRVSAVPALAAELPAEHLLRELLGEAARSRSVASDVDELRRRLVTSAACQAAIKINHPLVPAARQRLLDDLFRVENPTTCPHGRPALFRLSLEELERAFRRR